MESRPRGTTSLTLTLALSLNVNRYNDALCRYNKDLVRYQEDLQKQCGSCSGRRTKKCNYCQGKGTTVNNKNVSTCWVCKGRGEVECGPSIALYPVPSVPRHSRAHGGRFHTIIILYIILIDTIAEYTPRMQTLFRVGKDWHALVLFSGSCAGTGLRYGNGCNHGNLSPPRPPSPWNNKPQPSFGSLPDFRAQI